MSSSLENTPTLRAHSAPLPIDDPRPISPLSKQIVDAALKSQQERTSPSLSPKRVFHFEAEQKVDDYEKMALEIYETTATEAIRTLELDDLKKVPVEYAKKFHPIVSDLWNAYEKMVAIIEEATPPKSLPKLVSEDEKENLQEIWEILESYWLTDPLERLLKSKNLSESELNELRDNWDNDDFCRNLAHQIMEHRDVELFRLLPKHALNAVAAEATRRRDIYEEMLLYISENQLL